MKEELTTILEAMRAAHAELADYLVSGDRNAERPSPSWWAFSSGERSSGPCGRSAPSRAQARRNSRWPKRADRVLPARRFAKTNFLFCNAA
jgi:hypothetical protein